MSTNTLLETPYFFVSSCNLECERITHLLVEVVFAVEVDLEVDLAEEVVVVLLSSLLVEEELALVVLVLAEEELDFVVVVTP